MNFIKEVYALTIENPSSTLSGDRQGLNDLIGVVISLVFAAAGLLFLAMLFVGGFNYLTAGGDPKNSQAARARITNAIIGLIIVVAAFAVTQIVLSALGLDTFVEITP
jgi:hypothetical protein